MDREYRLYESDGANGRDFSVISGSLKHHFTRQLLFDMH